MAYLIDTSVLVRLANTADADYADASHAVVELHRNGEELYCSPQNDIEFRSVATRPVGVNGLGLAPVDAESKLSAFEAKFSLLDDTQDIFPTWKDIVHIYSVLGKKVHDARLVAVCHVHAVTHLLTFNVADFNRMAGYGNGLTVVDPASI